jgi:hypothetical protein
MIFSVEREEVAKVEAAKVSDEAKLVECRVALGDCGNVLEFLLASGVGGSERAQTESLCYWRRCGISGFAGICAEAGEERGAETR